MERPDVVMRRGAGKNRQPPKNVKAKQTACLCGSCQKKASVAPSRGATRKFSKTNFLEDSVVSARNNEYRDGEALAFSSDESLGTERGVASSANESVPACVGDSHVRVGNHKVQLKRLHVSDETRQFLRTTLGEIGGKRFDASCTPVVQRGLTGARGRSVSDGPSSPASTAAAASDGRLTGQYWLYDSQLIVEGATLNASGEYGAKQEDVEGQFRQYAVKQLIAYGFHATRCVSALSSCNGDISAALDYLLSAAFIDECSISEPNHDDNTATSCDDFMKAREEEFTALQAIYSESMVRACGASAWNINLTLPCLQATLTGSSSNMTSSASQTPSSSISSSQRRAHQLCRAFARGKCRRGVQCRYSHTVSRGNTVACAVLGGRVVSRQSDGAARAAEQSSKENAVFCLQVRFPDGCRYPFQAPLVCFSRLTTDGATSGESASFLQVTALLTRVAQQLATRHEPAVYQMVCTLHDNETLQRAVSGDYHPYSLPAELINTDDTALTQLAPPETALDGTRDFKRHRNSPSSQPRPSAAPPPQSTQANTDLFNDMLKQRQKLPAWSRRRAILDAVNNNQVVIISGSTGCGKSTQVPQFLLDEWRVTSPSGRGQNEQRVMIVCCQPRRISAVGVAERVARERAEKVGVSVGYQIHLESRRSRCTQLLFCTLGVLLRQMHEPEALSDVTHVIVDEVHERSDDSDFLLMLMRRVLATRANLRLVLMSATADSKLFSEYFHAAPVIDIPGRTFPVHRFYLERIFDMCDYRLDQSSMYSRRVVVDSATDNPSGNPVPPPLATLDDQRLTQQQLAARYPDSSSVCVRSLYLSDAEKIDFDLIETLLLWLTQQKQHNQHIPRHGTILVFLPGLAEIKSLLERLSRVNALSTDRFCLLPLHSSLTNEEQQLIFKRPPNGARKIILSTNLAETSITIDDCVIVIDAGRVKETAFDELRQMECLDTVWLSCASADQRCGRAGRVQPGVCFHLYTSHRYKHMLRRFAVPEILRKPLEHVILRVKTMPSLSGVDLPQAFASLLECPSDEAVSASMRRLHVVGALDECGALTPLGRHVAALPVDVRLGKLLVLGAVMGCDDAASTVAACLAHQSPFSAPLHQRHLADESRRAFNAANSDQLTQLAAFECWREVVRREGRVAGHRFARQHWMSTRVLDTLVALKQQYTQLLRQAGLASNPSLSCDQHSNTDEQLASVEAAGQQRRLVAALLCAALYPNVARVMTPGTSYVNCGNGALARDTLPTDVKFKTKQHGYVYVHPSSVMAKAGRFECPFVVFHEAVRTSRLFMRGCTMVPVYPLLLFCGPRALLEQHGNQYVIALDDGWIKVASPDKELACMLIALRDELSAVLESRVAGVRHLSSQNARSRRVVDAITRLLTTEL